MSYLQAFNFSSPFPNFGAFGGAQFAPSALTGRYQTPAGTAYTSTAASNGILVNPSPQSPAAAAAAQLPIPESIVPNYNPNAQTDYYGNPNQNFGARQAVIPPEYQQQQQIPQQQGTATLQIPPIGAPQQQGGAQRQGNGRDNQDGSFDVIIHENENTAQDPGAPGQQPQRKRRQRKPPRVINYSPVYPLHYVAPLGHHHVQLHTKSLTLHDVIDQDAQQQHNPQQQQQSNILNGNANQNIPSVIPPIPSSNNNPDDDGDIVNSQQAGGTSVNINLPSNGGPPTGGNPLENPPAYAPPSDILQNPDANLNSRGIEESIPNIGSGANNQLSAEQVVPDPQQQQQQQPGNSQTEPEHEKLRVTPIQGPIFAKDGFVPVVPLYHYNSVKNGTYYQIPILWTALSYALGLEIHGEILRGLPCIKRLNQLYCPSAGQTYPLQKIEGFIDENKALIRRMYGEFIMSSEAYTGPPGGNVLRRSTRDVFEDEVPDLFPDSKSGKKKRSPHHHEGHHPKGSVGGLGLHEAPADDHALPGNGTIINMPPSAHIRATRQTVNNRNGSPSQQPRSNRVDSCESTVEIVTPYWAANSGGKVRAIVNTQHFEQAIHQEVCRHTSTRRCTGECGCEQKYKWHRLLAYDPDNDCRGIFMDWFLFPSCCVCRCNPQ